jgi:hypothetical protein
MSGERVFVCDIKPRGLSGRWEVWVSEKDYLGAETDGICGGLGERQRIGGTWTRRWLVGRTRTRAGASRLAKRTVRKADRMAEREARWRDSYIHPEPFAAARPADPDRGERS